MGTIRNSFNCKFLGVVNLSGAVRRDMTRRATAAALPGGTAAGGF